MCVLYMFVCVCDLATNDNCWQVDKNIYRKKSAVVTAKASNDNERRSWRSNICFAQHKIYVCMNFNENKYI